MWIFCAFLWIDNGVVSEYVGGGGGAHFSFA